MKLAPWLQLFRSRFRPSLQTCRRGRAAVSRPAIEALEDRALLATFTVSNLNDSGAGSLRQAVIDANTAAGADVIDATGVVGTITLTTGQVTITEALNIEGPGANRLTISGNNASIVIEIEGGGNYDISDVTIADGNNESNAGGGVRIANSSALVFLNRLGFENNHGNDGGAVGISSADVQIRESTFVNNTSDFGGSAVAILQNSNVWILNSTFSGNESANNLGVIDQLTGSGETSLTRLRNVTVTNSTGTAVENFVFAGGTGTFEISNSILANNTEGSIRNVGAGTATINSLGHNIADDAAAQLTGVFDQTNTDPLIGPLAFNGAPLRTHALLAGSPAIDAGRNANAIDGFAVAFVNDNRLGPFRRFYDANQDGLATIDVGAFEYYGDLFVSTEADVVDEDHAAGQFSLREAVAVANAQPGPDTISFASGVGSITLTDGELILTESTAINGPGAALLTISGNDSSRIFRLGDIFRVGEYTVEGVTLTGGNGVGSRDNRFGGAIYILDEFGGDDVVTIRDSVIDNNTADLGGGIFVADATLNIIDSTISNNSATATTDTRGGGGIAAQSAITTLNRVNVTNNSASMDGGGIYNFTFIFAPGNGNAKLSIVDSSIDGNSAAAGRGGGIFNESQNTGEEAVLDVIGSSISGNTGGIGGGISSENGTNTILQSLVAENMSVAGGGAGFFLIDSTTRVESSTVSGNVADGNGGGFENLGNEGTGTLTLVNATVANNEAPQGEAINNFASDGGTVRLSYVNSIVADNTGSGLGNISSFGPGVSSAVSSGNNIFDDFSGNLIASGDQPNTDPMLLALADNGGPTRTHALANGSLAIDAGSNMGLDSLVKPASVTSTTSATDFRPVSDLISNPDFSLQNYTDSRDGDARSVGWITDAPNGGTGNDYFAAGEPAPVLDFEFSSIQSLTDVAVWGYNVVGAENNDFKDFTLELSVDGGQTFGAPIVLTKTRYSENNFVNTLSLGGTHLANFVRMTITDNYFGEPGNNGGDRVAFGEIRFLGQPVNDQRGAGFARQIDGDLNSTATVDIGAFEFTAPVLTVAVAADSISENGGSTTATVSRTGDTSVPLTVVLSSDAMTEATVPATVLIAVGQTTSAAFSVDAVDDTDVDGTQSVTITASATGVVSGTDTVDVTDDDTAASDIGNVDGDDDFDASDAFLIQLVQLAASNTQIDLSKGASTLTAAQIRANIGAIGLGGDVDGDNDFDASDSFLIQLVKLAAANSQIDLSKGASPLSAAEIRANVDSLGGDNSGQQSIASAAPSLAAVQAEPAESKFDLFEFPLGGSAETEFSTPPVESPQADEVWASFRSWIDTL